MPNWPVEWGGKDWTPLQRHIWHEEMQLANVPIPLAFNASMVGPVIAAFGSQELKERFLPKTANLDIWWSQGFSEPDAGSDLASLRTTAVREGDEYVVNGQKTWTTLGQYGDWIFTLVRTDPEAKKQAGISFLLIDMTSPGVTVRPIELIDGGFEVNEVFFDNVRVPAENLVGEENKGWDYAKFLLGNERVGVAPVGSTKRSLAAGQGVRQDGRPRRHLAARRSADRRADRRPRERAAGPRAHGAARRRPLRRRQAAPGLVGAQAAGHRAAAGRHRAVVDLAGPAALASGAGEGSDLPDWTRSRRPTTSTSARPRSTAAPTRCNADHRRHDPGTEGLTWTSHSTAEQIALRDAVRGLLAKAYDSSETRREVTKQDPGWDEKTWQRLAEMGALGLPFAEEDGGMGAGPVEVSIVAEEIGRVIAPEPYVEAVVLAGGLVAAAGTDEQRAEILGALAEGTLVPAFAHTEPGQRYSETAVRRHGDRAATPGR